MNDSTILTVTDQRTHEELLAALGVAAPGVDVSRIDPGLIRRLPQATAAFVSDAAAARVARATGFEGGIVVVGAPGATDDEPGLHIQGIHFVPRDLAPAALSDALAAAIPAAMEGAAPAVRQALARSRQLIAAGEIACGLQHAFNNPLTALMAEVQLLQMEAPNDDVRATAGRMLDLVRRLTELSRSLDGVRDRRITL